jgi:hypothetical protein
MTTRNPDNDAQRRGKPLLRDSTSMNIEASPSRPLDLLVRLTPHHLEPLQELVQVALEVGAVAVAAGWPQLHQSLRPAYLANTGCTHQ